MKNIRIYKAPKYGTGEFEEVEENIYRTYVEHGESENSLALQEVSDKELLKKLKKAGGWKKSEREIEEDFVVLFLDGKKYYKDVVDRDGIIYKDQYDEPELTYVTSIVFEAEPELDENEPTDTYISQYPLEDILDKFYCSVSDDYEEENAADPVNSYVEFSSTDIEDIRGVLGIVGKHVYNKEDGDRVLLMIE